MDNSENKQPEQKDDAGKLSAQDEVIIENQFHKNQNYWTNIDADKLKRKMYFIVFSLWGLFMIWLFMSGINFDPIPQQNNAKTPVASNNAEIKTKIDNPIEYSIKMLNNFEKIDDSNFVEFLTKLNKSETDGLMNSFYLSANSKKIDKDIYGDIENLKKFINTLYEELKEPKDLPKIQERFNKMKIRETLNKLDKKLHPPKIQSEQ